MFLCTSWIPTQEKQPLNRWKAPYLHCLVTDSLVVKLRNLTLPRKVGKMLVPSGSLVGGFLANYLTCRVKAEWWHDLCPWCHPEGRLNSNGWKHHFCHWSVGDVEPGTVYYSNFHTATEACYSNTWFTWVHREISIDDSTMAALNLLNKQSQSRWFCPWALPSYQCLLSCEPQRDLIWQAKGEGMEMEMACAFS